jgi:hypothetical protein
MIINILDAIIMGIIQRITSIRSIKLSLRIYVND